MVGRGKQSRGFASMDPEKQRRIASKGGRAAHKAGRAHEWTTTEAREAGRKGGSASHRKPLDNTPPDADTSHSGIPGDETEN